MFKDDSKFQFILINIMFTSLICFVMFFKANDFVINSKDVILEDYQYYAKENVKRYLKDKYKENVQLISINILKDTDSLDNQYKREALVTSIINGIKFDTYFSWDENKKNLKYLDDYQYNEIYTMIQEELNKLTDKEYKDLTITFYEDKDNYLNYESKNKLFNKFTDFNDNTFYKLEITVTYDNLNKIKKSKVSTDSILFKKYTRLNVYKLVDDDLVKFGDFYE